MVDPERYEHLVRRLDACGYEIQPNGQEYTVRHRHNSADVSHARHLDDLADLAELVEWAAQRHQQSREAKGGITES